MSLSEGSYALQIAVGAVFGLTRFSLLRVSFRNLGQDRTTYSGTQRFGFGVGVCLRGKLFYLQLELFCLQLSFFAYSPSRRLLDALSTVSKRAPTVSKKAKTVSEKAPTVSKKLKISTVS